MDQSSPPLDPVAVRQLGLVLSRFEFNGFPNPNYRAGKFELEIQGGIRGFVAPRPQVGRFFLSGGLALSGGGGWGGRVCRR